MCKDSKTVLSSNVKLLAGRNVRLGRPGVFVRNNGRLVAVGGTRAVDRPLKRIEIVRPPRLHSTPKVRTFFLPQSVYLVPGSQYYMSWVDLDLG